ncbi:MAG TPA: ferritin-like domain-containing protein [Caulobacteraceae bacterium]
MLSSIALLSRRHLNRALMATAVAAGMTGAGCAHIVPQGLGLALTPNPLTDPAVFNFALNLEYLEAEYYLRGVTGQGVPDDEIGPRPGPVTGGRQVSFQTPYVREFMAEIANDEHNHVRFLRRTIKASPLIDMSRPAIDLEGSFKAAGQAAGLGDNFDPFADENSFLLGAFLFEDVGVTAYNGAAKLISGRDSLEAAAGILAVEAYHGALIRTQIAESGEELIHGANAISAARAALDGPTPTEQGLRVEDGRYIIAPSDANGIAFKRTPQQVLNVVYLSADQGVGHGGFFPKGVNGVVHHT